MRVHPMGSAEGSFARTSAVAVLAVALLASLALTASPARAALSGSIVFIRDGDVWIMAADDPSSARPVTQDGTADSPYVAPVQSDDGIIYAVTADGFGEVVRLNQHGESLGAPFRPQSLAKIDDLDLSPDGQRLAVTSAESVQTPLGFVFAFFLDIAYADGRDSSQLPHNIDLPYAGWYSNDALAGSQYAENHFDISGLSTFELGATEPAPWHDTCRREPFTPNPFPEGCYLAQQPDFAPGLGRMATISEEVESLLDPPRVIVWDMAGAPPAAPQPSCTLDGEVGVGRFDRPTWSPEGDALAWTLTSTITGDEPAGAGVYVAEGFASGDCEQAFAGARLVAPGGTWPDWSPAALGTTPDPGGGDGPGEAPALVSGGDTVRLSGGSRFDTAAEAARRLWPDGADSVVLATGQDYPDALAGGPLAGARTAPILLTATDQLVPVVRSALVELDPDRVIILGGAAAVSQQVAAEVAGLPGRPQVQRVAGGNRFETAARVAAAVGAAPDGDVVIATGQNYPDAVAAGALTTGTAPPPVNLATRTQLITPLGDGQRGVLVGGTAALSSDVQAEAARSGRTPIRLAGASRFATSQAVAARALAQRSGQVPLILATGQNFPDALSAGAVNARTGGVLLLIPTAGPTAEQAQWIAANRERFTGAVVLGGTAAVSAEAEAQVRGLLGGAATSAHRRR